MMSAYRGYTQGMNNMIPTAVSEVIEALGKLCIGLWLAVSLVGLGIGVRRCGRDWRRNDWYGVRFCTFMGQQRYHETQAAKKYGFVS